MFVKNVGHNLLSKELLIHFLPITPGFSSYFSAQWWNCSETGRRHPRYLHQASNKVGGDASLSGDQTLSEFGETAVSHHSQCCMGLLKDTVHYKVHETHTAEQKGKLCFYHGATWSYLDVSGFLVLVLDSSYTAVLFLQTGHGAFY